MNTGATLLWAFFAGLAFWCAVIWFGSLSIAAGLFAIIIAGILFIAGTDATYQEGK